MVEKSPPRLLQQNGRPNFGLNFYAVNKKGEYGGASFTGGRYAVADEKGGRLEDLAALYS